MPKLFGGKPKAPKVDPNATAAASGPAKKLFSPEQIQQATKDYGAKGTAKWNQILSNMGAGGGTGGDLTAGIEGQAKMMQDKLAGLTDQSGFGSDGMGQIDQILRSLEKDIGAKYAVY